MVGHIYRRGTGVERDYQKALSWYQKAASQENLSAEEYIGEMHAQGLGLEQNQAKAAAIFEKAAEKESEAAMYHLATFYDQGIWYEKDQARAFDLLKQSAEEGYSPAQFKLAKHHAKNKEYTEALKWLKISIELVSYYQVDPKLLDEMVSFESDVKKHLSEKETSKVETLAMDWLRDR